MNVKTQRCLLLDPDQLAEVERLAQETDLTTDVVISEAFSLGLHIIGGESELIVDAPTIPFVYLNGEGGKN